MEQESNSNAGKIIYYSDVKYDILIHIFKLCQTSLGGMEFGFNYYMALGEAEHNFCSGGWVYENHIEQIMFCLVMMILDYEKREKHQSYWRMELLNIIKKINYKEEVDKINLEERRLFEYDLKLIGINPSNL